MEIKVLSEELSEDAISKVVSGILDIVEDVFIPEMRGVYKDDMFFREQILKQGNINIVCFNSKGELTGYLLAIPQSEAFPELKKYDPDFESDTDNQRYYVEIVMSDSKKNHESTRSSFLMINELIRESDRRGRKFITMHALREKGLNNVLMRFYPVKLIRTIIIPELYGDNISFDFLEGKIAEVSWMKGDVV